MSLGAVALILAVLGAGWLLFRLGRGEAASGGRAVTLLKVVVWLSLAAVLFAAKLSPLAFMVLLAAGGVTAIEMWRDRVVKEDEAATKIFAPPVSMMGADEAAAILGIATDADLQAVRAAHKKLIAQIHPDKGGTDYLAAKINQARDVMMAKAESRLSPE